MIADGGDIDGDGTDSDNADSDNGDGGDSSRGEDATHTSEQDNMEWETESNISTATTVAAEYTPRHPERRVSVWDWDNDSLTVK